MLTAIDHIVMTVQDMDKTITFYRDVLGMSHETFQPATGGAMRHALVFGQYKINLHPADAPYSPHADDPRPGSVDICLLSTLPVTDWCARFAGHDIILVDGPVERTGATGPILSVYVRDPDGNLIEIANRL